MSLLVAVAVSMSLDLLSFSLIVPLVGIGAESNPVMVRMYLTAGILGVALLKVLTTAVILGILLRIRVPSARRLAAGLGITLGLIGFVGNLSALFRA
jgi:hypothetical protein